ncbi:MAG TPA: aldo/keto reductase, partial [Gammaproteobacteria bacterium]|nr:aldo/keto reductase [Gammaproteobacteria bacterium]
ISSFDFSKDATIKSVDHSLQALQTDYLDLILVHSDGNDIEIIQNNEIFETLAELKKIGKIRHFGMSTKTVEGGKLALEKSDVAMVTYNPIDTQEREVIAYAHQLQKGILIKKALASGHIDKISQNENPIKKSMEFILKEPGVHSIVIGTLNMEHLKEVIHYATHSISI